MSSGEILLAREAVGEDYEKALQLRMALRQGIAAGKPIYSCPLCVVPVHLVSLAQERRFHFRHETEDGRCPVRTKGNLSPERILAMKYDGARESAAHIRMKEIIAASLRCDPDFSDVKVEPVWKGEANERRKPDVRAVWRKTLPVAFEVQLSTTFLRVIAERRSFYLSQGGLLFWVFQKFDMGNARLTQEDVFYNNNRNAFLASAETLAASEKNGKLILDCVWSEPSIDKGQLLWAQHRRFASFSELTIEQGRQRAFLFDADSARERCHSEMVDWPLRENFRCFWLDTSRRFDDGRWATIRTQFKERGLVLPQYPRDIFGFQALLDSLYSAQEGRPIGWGYADLVKVAHHVFDRYKGFLWAFKLVLEAHDMGAVIKEQDDTRNWRKKVKAYAAAWTNPNSVDALSFAPDRRLDDLVVFLFPEIEVFLRKEPYWELHRLDLKEPNG